MKSEFTWVIVLALMFGVAILIAWKIATSDLPFWFKFWLLK